MIVWMLRNISLHLWITTLMVLPLSFYLLARITLVFPETSPALVGLIIISVIFCITSFIMDFAGKKIISNLLKDGQSWERTGIMTKAGKRYIRALRVYDSFLLWPFSAKNTVKELCAVIARFQMNTGLENEIFNRVVFAYLKSVPQDKDVAKFWLSSIAQSDMVTLEDQELLTGLAEHHESDAELSQRIMEIFIGLGRTDYSARKLYTKMQETPGFDNNSLDRISELVGSSEEQTLALEAGVLQAEPEKVPRKPLVPSIFSFIKKLFFIIRGIWGTIASSTGALFSAMGKVYGYIKDSDTIRFILKTGTLSLIGVWLVFFMFNTVTHMMKSKPAPEEHSKVETRITMPFTIQVAAFSKKDHAERYMNTLNKKGLEARVSKVGNDKKIWYAVRISEFIDKKSAAEYGRKLKAEKTIDDFFVSNR